jgi:hypothetical protein
MAVNPYFKDYRGEQRLLDDLTIETIKVMGRDLIYLPREYLKIDPIFGEDPKTYFKDGFIMEMYVRETMKFGGNKDIMTKFGITITDRLTIDLSITRFGQEVTAKNPSILKPREGDLIYYPLSRSIFEINFVEDEEPFYQFGTLTTYTLICELFTYSHEEINTGFSEIDEVYEKRNSFAEFFGLTGNYLTNATKYLGGETVFQSNGYTGITATISNSTGSGTLVEAIYDSTGKATGLYLTNVTGTFSANQTIKGMQSNTEAYMYNQETTIVNIAKGAVDTDVAVNNDAIEKEASFTIEFSSDNPFSENC